MLWPQVLLYEEVIEFRLQQLPDYTLNVTCPPPAHGLSSDTTALITSDCDAMHIHAHQMALITSGR